MENKKRIITNTDWFDVCQDNYNIVKIEKTDLLSIVKNVKGYTSKDIVIINAASKLLIYHCIGKMIHPNIKLWLISIDIILSKPTTLFDKLKAKLLIYLFANVNFFILYMKDWSGYKQYYKIKDNQLKYIPFKVNSYEELKIMDINDDGYIFSGGMSKRDYGTLFKAVDGLDVKLVVLVPPSEVCQKHGTSILDNAPENVTIINDDFSVNSWNECIAKAKYVVIQICKDTISPTGISTYLVAMALKKCVIMTEGPASTGIIPNDCAVIIKPADINELRKAITMVNSDDNYRNYIAENGYNYAMSLKGHSRLVGDIVEFIGNNIR